MIIYNIAKYIIDNTSIDLVINGWVTGDSGSMISDSGGNSAHSHKRKEKRFQILSRNEDRNIAYREAFDMSEFIDNRFCVTLPEANFDGTVYPEILISQMSVINLPQYIGTDDNGKHEFSFNIIVITN